MSILAGAAASWSSATLRALEPTSELTTTLIEVLHDPVSDFIQVAVTLPTDSAPFQNLGARRCMSLIRAQLRDADVSPATRQLSSVTRCLLVTCRLE